MKDLTSILSRYVILLILGLGNLFIFYIVITPLTVYPVYWILSIFYNVTLMSGGYSQVCSLAETLVPLLKNLACMNTTLFFKGYFASIIPACIAGSAYYLLMILNLSTPMNKFQRLRSLFFLLGSFLLLNIIRIFTFTLLFANKGFEIFNIAHVTTWYFGSTVLVILLWFSNVILFKIKSVPIYTDFKIIFSHIRGKK